MKRTNEKKKQQTNKRTYEYDEVNILNEIRNLPIPIRHKYYVDTSKD